LATVTGLLNPRVLVLGGSIARAGSALREGITEVLPARSIPLASNELIVRSSQSGSNAGLVGAALLAAETVLSPAQLSQWIGTAPHS
ncbi:MAG: ROK family protein, partial [Mycetocola sp.]